MYQHLFKFHPMQNRYRAGKGRLPQTLMMTSEGQASNTARILL
mgnify:FL=1